MRRLHGAFAALALLCAPSPAAAQEDRTAQTLREQDLRLARIAERLQLANADLCVETMPLTGLLLHSADQYRRAPESWFADGRVAVMDVVPGSPAANAGIAANDAIVAVGGDLPEMPGEQVEQLFRDRVFQAVSGIEGDLHLTLRRNGSEREVVFPAPAGCRALVEVLANDEVTARSDGRLIQLSYGLAARLTDEQLAVVFAHELAHSVLLHRKRLENAGVEKGFFGEFGRNRRLNRQVEIEADRMSVYLLYNAGYDPAIAPAFWASDASEVAGGGIFRSRIYPSRSRRAELVQEELEIISGLPGGPPYRPDHLLERRDRPFDD